jgi:hypothetical protein
MITNDSFYGLVFERDRVQTLLDNCPEFQLSAILDCIIDRHFCGWNKADAFFRVLPYDTNADLLYKFFQQGRITFEDLLAAYNWVTYSSINPKYQGYFIPGGTVIEDDTPAVTDDFEEVQKVELNNPRWEHKNTTQKENSPKKAVFNDTIILMADVIGIPENGLVTFEIFDTSLKPPKPVGNAKGKNVSGVAKSEWVVAEKTSLGDEAKLEFQASAGSKTSTRCTIPISTNTKFCFSC